VIRRAAAAVLVLGACAACGAVRAQHVRPDYDEVDRVRTVRLTVVVAPLPEGGAAVGELVALVARRYVNHHRDFIARRHVAAEVMPADACAGGAEGVLALRPVLARGGEEVEAAVDGRLTRCRDGEEVWSARATGKWGSDDAELGELTARYASELGEGVRPYVAPSFRLLRAALDTLPRPALADDAAVMEKIELGE
jgi:probable lipoprotein (TIGR04455 family)